MKWKDQNLIDRDHFIDILKGICIIFVVITHFAWSDEERLRFLFPFWIDMAVPIFMIISGYVYSFSYRKSSIKKIEDAYHIKGVLHKVIRYTLPFTIVYIIEVIWNAILGRYAGISIVDMIMALTFGFLTGGSGPGSYYYPIMIQFIFIYPIIYFAIKKYAYKGMVICGFTNAIYELLQRAYGMNEECYRLLIFRYILLISIGSYLASGDYVFDMFRSIISCVFGIVFIASVCYLKYTPKIIIYWTNTSFIACLYIIPIVMFMIDKLRKISIKPLEILGQSSYNIFLTQMIWYAYASVHCSNYFQSRFSCLITNLLICLSIGTFFYYVEILITKGIKRYLKLL